ncbi:MAG: EamA family transporter [Gammaproteobacteria bacterium]
MNNALLYGLTVLVWGSTWFAVKFQLGTVDPALSVVYRFALAAVLLFAWCGLRGLRLRFSLRDHGFMVLLGVFLFGLNYLLFYKAIGHITSGLVAVTFATITMMNMINGAIFLRTPLRLQLIVPAGLGLLGIALVFWPELSAFSLADAGFAGLLLCLLATYSASLGNIVSARNQRAGLPVLQVNAFSMAYGAALMLVYVLLAGTPVNFSWDVAYIGSLLYLAVFGSVIAFGCYLTLIGRIGVERAAYSSVLFPLVALAISTVFEAYHWSGSALAGCALIILGNILILRPPQGRTRATARTK